MSDRRSQSSTRSGASQSSVNMRSKVSEILTQTVPFFPALQQLETKYPEWMTLLGMFIEHMQIIALALNPHMDASASLRDISHVVYAVHFPFWDKKFTAMSHTSYQALFWIAVVVTFLLLGAFIILMNTYTSKQFVWTSRVCGALIHSCTSVFYIPILQGLLSGIVCNKSNTLWVFPTKHCYDGVNAAGLALGVIAMLLLFVVTSVVQLSVFDMNPFSHHLLARASNIADASWLVWKTLSVILFHFFLAESKPAWLAMYVAITAVFVAGHHAFRLPYYDTWTNAVRLSALTFTVLAGWIMWFNSMENISSMMHDADADIATLLVMLLPCWWAGSYLATYRVNREMCQMLPSLLDKEAVPPNSQIRFFPIGLPSQDLMYPRFRDICLEVSDQPMDDEDEEDAPLLLAPYISNVHASTDVELATRFLNVYGKLTGRPAPARMLVLGARMFTKGLYRFQDSDVVNISFTMMLYAHANKARLGLSQIEKLNKMEASLPVRYHAYKLQAKLKTVLNVRDNTFSKLCDRARKLHKEALQHMSHFWGKLLSDQVDLAQLAVLATMISQKREDGKAAFNTALATTPERTMLLKYANFLEQVVIEPEQADQIRTFTKQEAEERRRTAMRGARGGGGKADPTQALGQLQLEENQNDESKDVDGLRNSVAVMIVCLLCVVVGLLIYDILTSAIRLHYIDVVSSAGQVRALTQHAGYLSVQLSQLNSSQSAQQAALRSAIEATSRDLQSHHASLTYGKYRPNSTGWLDLMRYSLSPYQVPTFGTSTQTLVSSSIFSLGYEVISAIHGVYENSNLTTTYTRFLVNNIDSHVSTAFNVSLRQAREGFDEFQTTSLAVLAALFAMSLLCTVSLYVIVVLNFTHISQTKLAILNLFTLIPRMALEKLSTNAKERVEQYDETDDHDEDVDHEEGETEKKQGFYLVSDAPTKSKTDAEAGVGEDDEEEALVKKKTTKQPGNTDANTDVTSGDDSQTVRRLPNKILALLGCVLLAALVALGCSVGLYMVHLNDTEALDKNVAHRSWLREKFILRRELLYNTRAFALFGFRRFEKRFNAIEHELYRARLRDTREIETESWAALLQKVWIEEDKLTNAVAEAEDLIDDFLNSQSEPPETVIKDYKFNSLEVQMLIHSVATDPRLIRARQVLFNSSMAAAMREIERASAAEQTNYFAIRPIKTEPLAMSLAIVVIVMSVVSAALTAVVGLVGRAPNHRDLMFRTPLQALLLGAFTVSIASFVVAILFVVSTKEIASIYHDIDAVDHDRNETRIIATQPIERAQEFIYGWDRGAFNRYWEINELGEASFVTALSQEYALASSDMRELEAIAMRMAYTIAPVKPQKSFFVDDLVWDFATQVTAEAISVQYGAEALRYTNSSADLLQSPDALYAMSLFTLHSDQYADKLVIAIDGIDDTFDAKLADLYGKRRDKQDSLEQNSTVLLATTAASFALLVVYCAVSFNRYLSMSLGAGKKGVTRDQSALTQEFRTKASLVVIALLLAGLFAFGNVGLQKAKHIARNIDAATAREWLVARSMLISENYIAGHISPHAIETELVDVKNAIDHYQFLLYFGDGDSTDYNVVGDDAFHDEFLFGQSQRLAPSFACGYRPVDAVSDTDLLQKGAGVALLTWQTNLARLYTVPFSEAPIVVQKLRSSAEVLLAALRQSSSLYEQHERDAIQLWSYGFIAFAGAIILIVILVALFAVSPMVQKQLTEQAGTRLMLKMIPTEVKENVPAIAEFLQSGVAGAVKESSTNESSTEMSSVPIIAIDPMGIVLKFNASAEEVWGYTAAEVVGNNIKMLMPPKYSKHHDRFLANYRRTGVRKIIGMDREAQGQRKNGDIFPAELTIKEFKRENGKFVYIGFVKDITKKKELHAAEDLNNLIQEMATVPMIAIDALGTVLRFNKAAEECFGFAMADVLQQNVKMLMPEEIAKHHDQYLASYLRTRIKHVIDSSRIVRGIRKNGEDFPAEIFVKEITTSDFGAMSTYLGFVRDLTQDMVLDEANRINDLVANLSPVPIIGMDALGKILKYSAAAEEVFQYEPHEVLDQNIKMLMPEEIAERHDGYLEQYMRTGKKTIVDSEREVRGKRKDGTFVPLNALVKEVKKEGMPSTFIGYLIDLTEVKSNAKSKAIDDTIIELSAIPLITMDAWGLISRVNRAVIHEFGYRKDELLHKNIKCLMPDEIAKNHDKYLQVYRDTNVKHVIGSSRRVFGKKKNGVEFPLEIRVEEERDNEGNITFIGFARNLTEELNIELQFGVNNAIMDISINPMLAINDVGTILSYSAAGEKVFGVTPARAKGKNIKMLMPKVIADNHDEYLAQYKRTGIKHVIDTTRIVDAMHTSGRVFPIEVSVREVKKEGRNTIYVGVIRDRSTDGAMEQMIQLNKSIAALSALPLLQIDHYGSITHFNSAAEEEFGYSRDEIVGRNVKILCPDEIAKLHDGFLSTYRKTRVRNVIGQLRRSRAKRKDSSTFACELAIDEIEVEDGENTFVGYIRNCTEELRLIKANNVNDIISDLSPSPLIAINIRGQVLKFNAAASKAFGYPAEDVMGKNIKMLMPEEIAKHHDAYLSSYRKTGIKHVIDTTRTVQARNANGKVFPAQISVREIAKSGQDSSFIGYIRDCTDDYLIEQATKVADAIQTLSSIPMIGINEIGIIQKFNRAATVVFGYEENEAIGQNVKMLMAEDIARMHDGYLATYKKTGFKHVIDSTRMIQARKKFGAFFPAEISVREVEADSGRLYLAYVKDITANLHIEQVRYINTNIARSSSVPLIVIDVKGTIQMFVPAAEKVFGYDESEVLGQNIKMLMPDEIANIHDGYLERYLDTRVKHVIGSSRIATGKKKTGETFPARITVQEAKGKDEEDVYVGYVEDMSQLRAVELARKLADVVRDLSVVPIISISEDGIVRHFNPAAQLDFGYTEGEIVGQNVKILMPDDIAVKHDDILAKYKATGVKHVIGSTRQVPAKRKDGTLFGIEISVEEIMLEGQKVFVGYARDLTQENQLKQGAAVNDALVSLSVLPIIAITERGKIIKFSRAACEEFQVLEGDALGQNVKMLMPDAIANNHDGYLQRYLDTRVKHVIDNERIVPAKRQDGTTFQAEITVKEIKKEGKSSTYVGYVRNLTDEIEYQESQAFSNAIQSVMPDPLIIINGVGKIASFNRAACDLWGYDESEVLAQNVKMLMPESVAEKHDGYLQRYQDTGVKTVIDKTLPVPAKHKDGYEIMVELRVAELKFEETSVFVGYARDMRQDDAFSVAKQLGSNLIELNPAAIVQITHKGIITKFNAAAEAMFLFSREHVIGRSVKILMPEHVGDRHDGYLENYMKTGIKKVIDAVTNVDAERKTGEVFKAQISIKEIKQGAKDPLFVGFIRDLTAKSKK